MSVFRARHNWKRCDILHMWRYRWFHWHHVCLIEYFNSLVYHRNIFGSSLKVFGKFQKSSAIFGNFRKFSENVWECLSGLQNNFRKSSESGRKSSENHQKRCHQYVYIIKRTLHVTLKIWILCSRGKKWVQLTCEILFLPLERKIHIFSPPCNILYLFDLFHCKGSRRKHHTITCNVWMTQAVGQHINFRSNNCHFFYIRYLLLDGDRTSAFKIPGSPAPGEALGPFKQENN